MANKPPVLIMDLYYGALQVARSLGSRGIPVYGIDKLPDPIAAHSRYITRLKAPERDEELKDFMIDFSKNLENKPVLFPMSDYYIRFFLKFRNALSGHYLFPMDNPGILAKLVSKVETAKLLAQLEIDCPKTIFFNKGISSLPSLDGITFPCILKPNYHDYWEEDTRATEFLGPGQRIAYIENHAALREAVNVLNPMDDMVLQEFIPGYSENHYYYVGYRGKKGIILLSYVGNKIRTFPDCLGCETLLRSIDNPELVKQGNRILHRLNYYGPAGIDFKFDPRDSKYKVIEINARLGINDCYLAEFGADMPNIYYLDSQKKELSPHNNCPAGITWYHFGFDFDWMRTYRRKYNLSWSSWIRDLVFGFNNYAVFSWRDPAPFMHSLLKWTSRRTRKALGLDGRTGNL